MNEADFFDLLNLDLPEMKAVKEAVDSEGWGGAKHALANHIRERKSPRWFYDWHDRPALTKKFEDFGKAEKLLQHEFTFGFAGAPEHTAKFDDRIDWSANPSDVPNNGQRKNLDQSRNESRPNSLGILNEFCSEY